MSYINKLGGKKPELNDIARSIWFWYIDKTVHLTAAYVAGALNIEADEMSRKKQNDDLEWTLEETVFRNLTHRHPNLEIDLFASRLNHKLACYVSRHPEPDAWAVNAFSLTWSNNILYIFPPFSLICRILQKLEEDRTREAILVAPIWTTQIWCPCLIRLICGQCYRLPNPQTILKLPHNQGVIYPLKKDEIDSFSHIGRLLQSDGVPEKTAEVIIKSRKRSSKNNITHILRHGINSAK